MNHDEAKFGRETDTPHTHVPKKSSWRILMVDDDLDLRGIVVKLLNYSGYEMIDTASDGADAWQALLKVRYDLVITDHKMPKVTGLELIQQMRAAAMWQPVILVSGTLPTQEIEWIPELRIDAMLAKPFAAAELLTTMENLLRVIENPAVMKANQMLKANELPIVPTQTQLNSPTRILLVDDDRDFRELQKDLLTAAGYEVESAHDGMAGWEALRTNDYDLVITDNHMPRMTGLKMIENLHAAHMTIPVIMATGNLPAKEFARRPWLKPEATLQKPYTDEELLATVRNVLDPDDGKDDRKKTLLPKFP
jgi:DNA-binding response OmpR family regulator